MSLSSLGYAVVMKSYDMKEHKPDIVELLILLS